MADVVQTSTDGFTLGHDYPQTGVTICGPVYLCDCGPTRTRMYRVVEVRRMPMGQYYAAVGAELQANGALGRKVWMYADRLPRE